MEHAAPEEPKHWSDLDFEESPIDSKVRSWLKHRSLAYQLLVESKELNPKARKAFEPIPVKAYVPMMGQYCTYYDNLFHMRLSNPLYPQGHYEALDLGAAPGGFAKAAAERGLSVTALSLPTAMGGLPFVLKDGSVFYRDVDLRDPGCLDRFVRSPVFFQIVNVGVTIGAQQKLLYSTCEEYTTSKREMIANLVFQSLRILSNNGTLLVTLQTTVDILCFILISYCRPLFERVTIHPSARPKSSSIVLVFTGYKRPSHFPRMDMSFEPFDERMEEVYLPLASDLTKAYLAQATRIDPDFVKTALRAPKYNDILSG